MSGQALCLRVPPCAPVARRTCCTCAGCIGAAQSPASADSWHLAARLTRALRRAKRSGYLWRQRVAERQLLPGLMGLPPRAARRFQKAFDELFELDVRIACEASGQEALLRGQPEALQQMILAPGLLLVRPAWLRAHLLQIWIGARVAPLTPALELPRYDAHDGAQAGYGKSSSQAQGGASYQQAVSS